MTAKCGGGTSSVITGVTNNLVLATGAAGIFSLVPGLEWLVAVGSALGVLTYDLTTVCATDPPAIPTFTASEVIAFTTGAIGSADFNSFIQKAHDVAAAIVWDKYCKCDSGATPTTTVYPTQPPVATITTSTTSACYTGNWNGLAELDNVACTDMSSGLPNVGFGGNVTQGSCTNIRTAKLPPGVTNIRVRARTEVSDAGGSNGASYVIGFWSNTTNLSNVSPTAVSGAFLADLVSDIAVPSGTVFVTLLSTTSHLSSTTKKNISVQLEYYCGTAAGAVSNPCPSDPAVLALLNQILTLLTLIQRQLVPFAYVLGAVHSAISGSGILTVSQLVGMKIELTTVSTVVGLETADPDELFEAGWISWGSVDGFEKREFISKNPYISFPPNAQILDRFSYNLRPGVVARFTELEREA